MAFGQVFFFSNFKSRKTFLDKKYTHFPVSVSNSQIRKTLQTNEFIIKFNFVNHFSFKGFHST